MPVNELAELLRPFWSEEKVCRELALAEHELRDLEAHDDILALPTSDPTPVNIYPVEQFERADGRVRVRPALQAVFRELRATDRWTVAIAALRTAAPELDDRTPLDAARDGVAPERLAAYARRLAAEWR
ncbi:hypothetical protein FE697_008185 [Mumia zhuanghuii]|uniref:Antitoxin Xre/MbcA/ParS-like toxin-binding domain-containing protein n=2 Tax=Mumia TaxID=1546255 RepID=A0ABW1QKU0_9ACTN|nr:MULTISPECIES: hypothetical protein [Mumia]KAA1423567.1 hypothetical protein FE697_008185 [Mumia zhuanghuii]